ncbi:MAG: PPC domain-containing DNA-binding protein [Patescibacteria group bacterium]|jgi:hypothetical protein
MSKSPEESDTHEHHGEILLVLSRGEEVVSSIVSYCQMTGIESAWISGLGSVQEANIAYYELDKKKYHHKKMTGTLELANLVGNITIMDNKPIAHLHAVLSDQSMKTYGGHLNSATVGATCEILINPFGHAIEREPNQEIGLNLIK